MTNEELVKLIQDGQEEYIPQLWDQVYKYICLKAKRRLIGEADNIKQLEDDLINEAYFDFLIAVNGYKSDGGARFLTYLTYSLKNSFNRALGIRSNKDKHNIMHNVVSLDAPLENAEDITLHDLVADQLSEDDHRFVENKDFWDDVHELLENAILTVTEGQGQDILLTMLHKNCIPGEAIRFLRIPEEQQEPARVSYYTNLNRVRKYVTSKAKQECRRIGIDDYIGYRGVGVSAWKRHGFTSIVELEAVSRVDRGLWDRVFSQHQQRRRYRKF
ncbi:MAG: hypothetical protein PHV95_09120 [Eubacteriales bacterium]|nr:hypothetical protein [Eubacteriales bacterium]MDD4475928.1 hypothetical protein [Eubacteriales bacterium]